METTRKRLRILISGIPGAGKTSFGSKLAKDYGFRHIDLEQAPVLSQWSENPSQFVQRLAHGEEDTVVTWGFVPDDAPSVQSVSDFRARGFGLVWFDGNRPAALREFQNRGDVPEICFYAQMYKIEKTKIIEIVNPLLINPFEHFGKFKPTGALLAEIAAAQTRV